MSSVSVNAVVTASKQQSDLIRTTLLSFVGLLERESCGFFPVWTGVWNSNCITVLHKWGTTNQHMVLKLTAVCVFSFKNNQSKRENK